MTRNTAEQADRPIQPFLNAGAGLSYNRIDQMVYRFPALDPAGSTIIRGGDSVEFAWMAGGSNWPGMLHAVV